MADYFLHCQGQNNADYETVYKVNILISNNLCTMYSITCGSRWVLLTCGHCQKGSTIDILPIGRNLIQFPYSIFRTQIKIPIQERKLRTIWTRICAFQNNHHIFLNIFGSLSLD